MATVEREGEVGERLDRLQQVVEDQGRIIEEQRSRLDQFSSSLVSRMLHAPAEKDKTSRRDLLKRAGVAAAAAIGGAAVIAEPVSAATGGNFILGNSNQAGNATVLSPTASTAPNPLFKGVAASTKVGLQGNASGVSTFTVGMAMLAKSASGAWGLVAQSADAYDVAAVGTGRIAQSSLASGPPSIGSGFQEMTRDAQGLLWLSNGAGGWYPAGAGGLNIGLFTKAVTTQMGLAGSNGSTWVDMDATNLHITISPHFHCQAIVTVNADLFTDTAGLNQDIGVRATSSTAPPGVGLYPTTAGQPEAWKESGGPVKFGPNAAFLQTVLPMRAGLTYNLFAVWKANKAATSAQHIYAGAGPIGSKFSPTRMTVQLVPDTHSNVGATPVQPLTGKFRPKKALLK